jgi:hypothetical protein
MAVESMMGLQEEAAEDSVGSFTCGGHNASNDKRPVTSVLCAKSARRRGTLLIGDGTYLLRA